MKSLSISLSSALLLFVTGCQTETKKEEAAKSAAQTPPAMASAQANVAPTSTPASSAPDGAGWVTTASGLRYRVLASGPAEGRSPTMFDTVMVHYRGTLTDGTVFDSSIERGQPATFGVGQVIPGWTEALRVMKPGDQWVLYIPSGLAYGSRAVGDKIPANSDLIFQVALIQVVGGM
ncbi:FKBP-type peptidyl-prolyl cis-trans isomerase FklB [Prosthecobacter fusiformis]|uniref:Peptidyl-prolyl cis-trans isomerase n=1 Tax=Prosthecobacter fusiformis TaxID=48464 RepID=A0A4R7RIH5_9BACT|nr:FKBP-type peptidyl-prolyl cis-trans isomerase [Prosthecobacter fusiformis]TDU63147.1 FKBP-type peptidyl-prolyl cis-trans isomerase FklB [Prosthecobacter fusiformis]